MDPTHKDKTTSHYHTDPKLITQEGCKNTLSIGMPVYLDPLTKKYKPAIATSVVETSNVQGIVWSFLSENLFYLRVLPGPMEYRFPLTRDYFISIGGTLTPNDLLIPGQFGDRIWLSETVAGRFQSNQPTSPNITLLMGYKTNYGFLYQPKYICCEGDIV